MITKETKFQVIKQLCEEAVKNKTITGDTAYFRSMVDMDIESEPEIMEYIKDTLKVKEVIFK
jgi:hypothetical protein